MSFYRRSREFVMVRIGSVVILAFAMLSAAPASAASMVEYALRHFFIW